MVNFIHLITEKEKYEKNLFNEVKKIVLDNSKKNKLVKHLNIILSGPTGAGKSTLINKILNLIGEKAIKTAIGVPCTMGEPKYYESETVPLLRLADSRGIEKTNYRVEELSESMEKFIKNKLKSENPDLFIHCIWYCITGTRLEPIEVDTLEGLSRIYQSNSIPIIIVYIQAISKQKIFR
jgi:septin family protein